MKKQISLLLISTIITLIVSSCGGKKEVKNQETTIQSQPEVEKIICEYCGKSVPKNRAVFDDVRYNYFCSNNCYGSWLFQNSN